MNKRKSLLLAACLMIFLPIFLLGVYKLSVYASQKNEKMLSGPEILPSTTLSPEESDLKALLTKESGEVQFKKPGEESFTTLAENETSITNGTTVKTGEGLAHVIFPNNSIMSLSQNTEVRVDFQDTKINVMQTLGNTWHRVNKVLEGHTYNVETPSTLATVRGTEFNVGVMSESKSEVYVIESIVDVSEITWVADQMIKKDMQRVTADKHVFVDNADKSDKVVMGEMPKDKKNSAWFQRNKKITEVIKVENEKLQQEPEPEMTSSPDALPNSTKQMMRRVIDDVQLDPVIKSSDEKAKKIRIEEKQKKEKQVLRPSDTNNSVLPTSTQTPPQNVLGTSTSRTEPIQIQENQRAQEPTATPITTPTATVTISTSRQNRSDFLNNSEIIQRIEPTATLVPPTSPPIQIQEREFIQNNNRNLRLP